jgi:hypothetical protein
MPTAKPFQIGVPSSTASHASSPVAPLSLKQQQTLVYPSLIHDATLVYNSHTSTSQNPWSRLKLLFPFVCLSQSISDMDTRKQYTGDTFFAAESWVKILGFEWKI